MTLTSFRPESSAQAAEVVRWAQASGETLNVVGTQSKSGLGRPVRTTHSLDMSGLNGIVAYEPEELVLTAKAGTSMATISAMLAETRQQLAFEPQDLGLLLGTAQNQGTLGGVLACALAGPRRISAGSARDHTLGFEGVNGLGEIYRGGGKVVKNVTGYDVPKLMVGSYGTLTALTEITVKVMPAPEDTRTLVLTGRTDADAVEALIRAMQSPHEVSGAAHLPPNVAARSCVNDVAKTGASVTLLRLEGFAPSVSARVAKLKDEMRADLFLDDEASLAIWKEIRDVAAFAKDRQRQIWKISVPPSHGSHVAEAIGKRLDAELYFDWGGGLIWAAALEHASDAAAIIRGCIGQSGHATLVRAPDDTRATSEVFHPLDDPLMVLSRRVKESFDPRGILSPGRMYAGM